MQKYHGGGIRSSIEALCEYVPFETLSFKSGEKVLNWTIPQEWKINEAYITDESGRKVIDFVNSNLHVMSYSTPIDKVMPLSELQKYIYTHKQIPDLIPYVTSYYARKCGFCMSHHQFENLKNENYHAYIDSQHFDGELNIAHTLLNGDSRKEILLSSYLCHPSMANNEISGPLVLAFLYQRISKWKNRKYTYRFVLNPETIGSIAYLSKYGKEFKDTLYAGIVLTCLGRSNNKKYDLSYKTSRRGNSPIDNILYHFSKTNKRIAIRPFTPVDGSDERQYCSPGFNLPVGQIASLVYGEYPEYHTSGDTKALMDISAVIDNANRIEQLLKALECNAYYINQYPYGEIKLGDYDLYPTTNSPTTAELSNNIINDGRCRLNKILTILNYSDGSHSLLDIADKMSVSILELIEPIQILERNALIKRTEVPI